MGSVPPLLSFLLMIAAGWVHRHQLIVIQFLQAEKDAGPGTAAANATLAFACNIGFVTMGR